MSILPVHYHVSETCVPNSVFREAQATQSHVNASIINITQRLSNELGGVHQAITDLSKSSYLQTANSHELAAQIRDLLKEQNQDKKTITRLEAENKAEIAKNTSDIAALKATIALLEEAIKTLRKDFIEMEQKEFNKKKLLQDRLDQLISDVGILKSKSMFLTPSISDNTYSSRGAPSLENLLHDMPDK